jgi:ABC-type amino acid transport substrate-binding protein
MVECRRLSLFHFALLVLAVLCAGAADASDHDPIIRSPVIEIDPWGMTVGGVPTGIYYDLQSAIARRAGFLPILKIRPYIRIAAELKTNAADFTLMTENPQIVAAANKVDFLIDLDVLMMSRADAPIISLSALNGKTVGVLNGTSHHHILDGKAEFSVEPVYSTHQLLNLLSAGRVDAIMGVRQALLFELKARAAEEPPLKLAAPFMVGSVPAFVWLSKTSPPEWGGRLKTATESLKADGTIDEILKRYR